MSSLGYRDLPLTGVKITKDTKPPFALLGKTPKNGAACNINATQIPLRSQSKAAMIKLKMNRSRGTSMCAEHKSMIKRKAELVHQLLRDGSISTINERAALFAASEILFADIEDLISKTERSSWGQFDWNYFISQFNSFRASSRYYLGMNVFDGVAPGNLRNVDTYAYKFMMMII